MADVTPKTKSEKSMRMVMQTLAAGPQGIARPGTFVDVPESVACEWIDSRYAREFDKERDKKAQRGFVKPERSEQ